MSVDPDEAERKPQDHPLEGAAVATSHASGELTVSAITYTEVAPGQWDLKRAQHEMKLGQQLHQQHLDVIKAQQDADKAAHDLRQDAKDREDSRTRAMILFGAMLIGLGLLLVAGFLLAILSNDSGNRELGRGIILTVVAGVVGYAIGEKRS